MKIIRLEPYGYCAGVERAIKIAIQAKNDNPTKQVVVLGMLVHNEDALKSLENLGIQTIYEPRKELIDLIDFIPSNSVVILTAHGHSINLENKLIEKEITFIDATCPFVQHSFNLIKKQVNSKKEVLYIGKNNHPEAIAALSISKHVYFADFDKKEIPSIFTKDPLIIPQTTFSKDEIKDIVDLIKQKYPNAKEESGICNASELRQNTLLTLNDDIELIYVVGGKNSNNTKTLIRLAKQKYPFTKVIGIENASEINKKDLLGLSYIAISSGASTPKEVTDNVYNTIKLLCD